ncbi:acyl-CoA N-acyltransferase [Podospora australis]|uniref:Acyl-CoA N-acyltransferase n=1 Tax=Podospora australis TaxID=1536484 RepID=A0AAN6WTM6_9PEZI|nr:acyl-CoA N-acyltransferase [Podospora australis]
MTTTDNTLTFRVATPADAELVQPLVQSAYRGESSRQGWTTEADLLSGTRIDVKGIIEKITTPGSAVLLAFNSQSELVACCEVLKRDSHLSYFGMFAVDPKRQAGGLGRQVLGHAEEYARTVHGVHKMEMSVIWTRNELIDWYVRRGYRKTEVERPFPHKELASIGGAALRDDLHFVVLEKDLV